MVNYYFEAKKSLFVTRCLQESFILISKISCISFLEGPHNLPNTECQDRKKKNGFSLNQFCCLFSVRMYDISKEVFLALFFLSGANNGSN